jgi:NCAIR mutase (PurE)-related proteins
MEIRKILEKLAKREISVTAAEQELRIYSIEYVEKNLAKIDPLREMRSGIPEVIFAQGKEYKDLLKNHYSYTLQEKIYGYKQS